MEPIEKSQYHDLDKEQVVIVKNGEQYEAFSGYGTSQGVVEWNPDEATEALSWLQSQAMEREDFDIFKAMYKQHMEPEIVNQGFYMVDTADEGVQYYPASLFTQDEVAKEAGVPLEEVEDIGRKWGAALSAPGFLDTTGYTVHDTVGECVRHLVNAHRDEVQVLDDDATASYKYSIDLHERGEFKASVRDAADNVVFAINDASIFEDGFMDHTEDVDGLQEYLSDLGVIGKNDEVVDEHTFDQRLEDQVEDQLHAFISVDDATVKLRMGVMTASEPHNGSEKEAQQIVDYFNRLASQHGAASSELRNDNGNMESLSLDGGPSQKLG